MNLFVTLFEKELTSLKELNVKIIFSGRRENVPNKVWEAMKKLEEETN